MKQFVGARGSCEESLEFRRARGVAASSQFEEVP